MSFDNRSSAVGGNGGNPEMQSQSASLCKTGCGFYGNPMQEGLCSKCHKDKVKRLQQASTAAAAGVVCGSTPNAQNESRSLFSSASSLLYSANAEAASSLNGSHADASGELASGETLENKTVANSIAEQASQESSNLATSNVESKVTDSDAASATLEGTDSNLAKPKKNRCLACSKKVGLTGFGCRCGGLFCSTHRYSDMHDCSFNYKEHAQDQIRKNNPIVVGDKITKI